MRGTESMTGYNMGGSKIQEYLRGGSIVQIGDKPYTVYEMKITDTSGGQGTIYVMVPAKYEKMPKGIKAAEKGTKGPKADTGPKYDPKINKTSSYKPQEMMEKYFGDSMGKNSYNPPASKALKPDAGLPKYLPKAPQEKPTSKK